MSTSNQTGGYYQTIQQWPDQPFVNLDNLESSTNPMTQGSAAVQDVVNMVKDNPLSIMAQFETQQAQAYSSFPSWQPCAATTPADQTSDHLQEHVTLERVLQKLSHIYEPQDGFLPHRLHGLTLNVDRAKGRWHLSGPLTGLPDPAEMDPHALTPTEQVAVTAMAQERKVLLAVAAAAKTTKPADAKMGEKANQGG